MTTSASVGSGDANIDREQVCYQLTSTGSEVHVGVKRHDDTLPGAGFLVFDSAGMPVDTNADGYTEVVCDTQEVTYEAHVLCDNSGDFQNTPFLRHTAIDRDGTMTILRDTRLDGVTAYTTTGNVSVCGGIVFDHESHILCDDNGTFIRTYSYRADKNNRISTSEHNSTLDGGDYDPVGAVHVCDETTPYEYPVCADGVQLMRRVNRRNDNETVEYRNAVTNIVVAAPAAFTVGPCPGAAADTATFEFEGEILCDDGNRNADGSATRFLRTAVFNMVTGALDRISDFTLDGAPYTVVGPVATCGGRTIDETQWCIYRGVDGSSSGPGLRRVTRDLADGSETITWHQPDGVLLAPQPTTVEINRSHIGPCLGDNIKPRATILEGNEQWLGANSTTRIPANERLTGLTMTVLEGEATFLQYDGGPADGPFPEGFSMSWSVNDDDSELLAPQNITASGATSRVAVNWTTKWPVL